MARIVTKPEPTDSVTSPGRSSSWLQSPVTLIGLVLICVAVGLTLYFQKQAANPYEQLSQIKFKTGLTSNSQPTADLTSLKLTTADGNSIDLNQFVGKSKLVFVVLRGYNGSICPFCSAQTQRLVNRYEDIKRLGAEVIVAYPIKSQDDIEQASVLVQKSTYGKTINSLPFTFAVDVNLQVVDQLGIRADLSKPATYILDKEGKVRFAYVGERISDRPSVDEILTQLQSIESLP